MSSEGKYTQSVLETPEQVGLEHARKFQPIPKKVIESIHNELNPYTEEAEYETPDGKEGFDEGDVEEIEGNEEEEISEGEEKVETNLQPLSSQISSDVEDLNIKIQMMVSKNSGGTPQERLSRASGVKEHLSKEESRAIDLIVELNPDATGENLRYFLSGMRTKGDYILVQAQKCYKGMETSIAALTSSVQQSRAVTKEITDGLKLFTAQNQPQPVVEGSSGSQSSSKQGKKGSKKAPKPLIEETGTVQVSDDNILASIKIVLNMVGLSVDDCFTSLKLTPREMFNSLALIIKQVADGVDVITKYGGKENLTEEIVKAMTQAKIVKERAGKKPML